MGGSTRRKTRTGRLTAAAGSILVVNIIPKALSGEAEQDSEPSLAVNPADPKQIVATAFTPDPLGGTFAPIFVSSDGGNTWTLRSIVASGARLVFGQLLGNQRTGGDLSIATDPQDSRVVYLAWASIDPETAYTLHVRRSADGGQTWSANDLRTKARATNPALAVNEDGKVCFLYQQLKGSGASQRWQTIVERSDDGGVTWTSNTLANVPANAPAPDFQPYIGDYIGLTSVGLDFYGIFSANNSPDLARFPSGVVFQRHHDFTTRRLFNVDGTTQVSVSIDPFFFKITDVGRARRAHAKLARP